MVWVFWASALLLLHTYIFYPLLLILIDGFRQAVANLRFISGAGERRGRTEEVHGPSVAMVVAAYNEESCIGDKLANTLSLDYPAEKLKVLIGSDGSSDRTDAIVQGCTDDRVTLSAAPRGGKVAVLNRCIPSAEGEIVVLTDANTMLDGRALKKLMRHFRDPAVGAVCGRLRLYNKVKREYEESAYWTYESLIKFYEGKHGAVLGANGGIYAIRKSLFTPLPPDTIVDDFVIPMRLLQAGFKVIYDAEAVAFEETTEDYAKEAGRRARIAAGNFQALRLVGSLLSPTAGFVSFAFWSHKVLRWVAPFLMAAAVVANLFLLNRTWAWLTLGTQCLFYGLALAGAQGVLRRSALRRPASLAYYFTSMNYALAVGFVRFLRNSQAAAWNRTAR
jgi:cellulose synthase/poly-beta-1,6-N-acetylglucosamine synthase-like glycosyltransferase